MGWVCKMSELVKTSKTRVYAYDVLRILAVLAVVMIHVAAPVVKKSDVQSIDFIWGNIFHGITRIAVPVFLMLSGALMLDENKKISSKKIFHSAGMMFFVLVVWSLVYAVFFYVAIPLIHGSQISFKNFINAFIYGHYHLWYMYMIVGLYLLIPVLRTFVKKENKKVIQYFLVLSAIVGFAVKFLNFFLMEYVVEKDWLTPFVDKFEFGFISVYLTYYIAGWYIANFEIKKVHRICLYIVGGLSLLITLFATHFYSQDGENVQSVFHSNNIITVLLYSIAFFTFFYYLFKNKKFEKTKGMLINLSNLTFGVYLIHVIVLYLVRLFTGDLGSTLIKIVIEFVGTTVVSFAVCFIMSKLPILKKLIKC